MTAIHSEVVYDQFLAAGFVPQEWEAAFEAEMRLGAAAIALGDFAGPMGSEEHTRLEEAYKQLRMEHAALEQKCKETYVRLLATHEGRQRMQRLKRTIS